MIDEDELADLPDWQPRVGLDVAELANALEHVRRSAYMHWLGDAFDPEHMQLIGLIAAQALCGQPIEAPVDLGSQEYKTRIERDFERLKELFDDDLERAATMVAAHDHDFQPDSERPYTSCCAEPRCRALRSNGTAHHPYMEVKTPDSRLIGIDEGLVDLVEGMWKAGVETRGCCRGGCCEDTEETMSPAWLVHAVAGRDLVAAALADARGLRWLEPHDGFVRAEWDAVGRCVSWDSELERQRIGSMLVGVRIEPRTES